MAQREVFIKVAEVLGKLAAENIRLRAKLAQLEKLASAYSVVENMVSKGILSDSADKEKLVEKLAEADEERLAAYSELLDMVSSQKAPWTLSDSDSRQSTATDAFVEWLLERR